MIEWIETSPDSAAFVRVFRRVAVINEPWELQEPRFDPTPPPRVVRATVAGSDERTGLEEHWVLTLGPPGLFSVSPVRH